MHSSISDSNSSVCMGGVGGGVVVPHTTKQLWDTSWGSYNLIQSLGSPNLLEQLTELRKPIYPLDYQFIRKDMPGYESTPRWKDTHSEILNKWASVGHGGTQRHSGSPSGSSPNAILLGFYGAFPALCPLPAFLAKGPVGNVGLRVLTFQSQGWFPWQPAHILVFSQNHLVNKLRCGEQGFVMHIKMPLLLLLLRKLSFRSSAPEMGQRPNLFFLL